MKISATIVAFNEERNIARAIRSLRLGAGCADEIVVVDSGSSDHTREIAASLGARVVEEPWRGYAAQKNFAASCAANDWILSIDADEELTPGLAAEIATLKDPTRINVFDAYTMPRLARYLGRWIRHSGWYPDRKVRLYHRQFAEWQGRYVHESVQVDGTIGQFNNDLLHYTCDSLDQHLHTLDRYTSLAAQAQIASRQADSVSPPGAGSAVDVLALIYPPARLPRWRARVPDCRDGGLLYLHEIRQGAGDAMKILHLDSGREMRGGQWQVLRLHRALLESGHDSFLLARETGALLATGGQRGLPCEALRPLRLISRSRGVDLVHAHDAPTATP